MNKKERKNLKKLIKQKSDPDYIVNWIKEHKKEIPDDWENRINSKLKEFDDSILVKKNNIYIVEKHEIEMYINLKAKIDETINKIKNFLLIEKTEDVYKHNKYKNIQKRIKDLLKLYGNDSEVSRLIIKLLLEVKKKYESYFPMTTKKFESEKEKKEKKEIVSLIAKFYQIKHEISNAPRFIVDFEFEKLDELDKIETMKHQYDDEFQKSIFFKYLNKQQ